jgi:CheY-like chemotaxis protein
VTDDPALASPKALQLTQQHSHETASVSILLVEDNLSSAFIVRRLLTERFGYRTTLAISFQEAVHLIASQAASFQLLVSDISLPDGDGCELMRAFVRAKGPSARGIALSGRGLPEDISRSLAAGFSCHLTKPVTSDTLKVALEKAISGVD